MTATGAAFAAAVAVFAAVCLVPAAAAAAVFAAVCLVPAAAAAATD